MFIQYSTGVLAPVCEILAKKYIGTAALLSELTNERDADDVIHWLISYLSKTHGKDTTQESKMHKQQILLRRTDHSLVLVLKQQS
jgi:hypothetical protein